MIANFMFSPYQDTWCSDVWWSIILGVSVRGSIDEIHTWNQKLSKAVCVGLIQTTRGLDITQGRQTKGEVTLSAWLFWRAGAPGTVSWTLAVHSLSKTSLQIVGLLSFCNHVSQFHVINHIISTISIYLSIYLSIYPSIHHLSSVPFSFLEVPTLMQIIWSFIYSTL
jgi:hypothetical protein